jgi:uncharacterized membrane protein YidH (DUF202 family)
MDDSPDADDLEERDPGLAMERTSLAWTRTAISFAALGGAVLKVSVAPGLVILLIAPLVWRLGRLHGPGGLRLWLITVSIVFVAALSLGVALLGQGASHALRP